MEGQVSQADPGSDATKSVQTNEVMRIEGIPELTVLKPAKGTTEAAVKEGLVRYGIKAGIQPKKKSEDR